MTLSKQLFEMAKALLPGGVNSPVRAFDPYPFFVKGGRGSRIFDVDGKEYVDFCLAYGALILGHAHPSVVNRIKEQLDQGIHFGAPSEFEVKLSEKIVKHIPCAEMVRFTNSGMEATSSAVRLARAYTGREKILMFDGCYHGAHDHFLFDKNGAKSPGVPKELAKTTLVCEFNDIESVERATDGNELAAIIVEPVMGNMGCIPPEKEFLRGLREICDKSGALLIFDEVITGFRLSLGGAQAYYKVVPDLATFGKIIGGGFPIGAFAGKREIMQEVAPAGKVYHAGTFCGHTIAMIAGLSTIEEIEKNGVIEKATAIAARICNFLKKESEFTVNRVGPMFQIFFTRNEVKSAEDARKSDRSRFMKFQGAMLSNGVFVPPSQFECWFTSSAHDRFDLERVESAIMASLSGVGDER